MTETVNKNSNARREPSLMLKEAFGLADKGAKSTVQCVQLGAAAIMVRHADLIDSGHKLPSLAALVPNDTNKARTDYLSALILAQCTVKAPSKKGADVATFNVQRKKHLAQRNALTHSLTFAAALDAANIGIGCFDDTAKMFKVPARMILEPTDVPAEVTVTNNKLVLLDGARHGVVRDKAIATVAASVAQVNKVHYMVTHNGAKPPSKGANNISTHAAGTTDNTEDKQEVMPLGLPQMVKSIATLAAKVDQIMMTAPVMPMAELETDMIAAFSDMAAALDTWNAYVIKAQDLNKKAA